MQLNFSSFNGQRIKDLKGQDRINFVRALGKFLHEPTSQKFSHENNMNIQAWRARQSQFWTDKADFPAADMLYPSISPISATPFFDEGYKEFFKMLDFTGGGKGGFKQLYLSNTLALENIPAGAKANIWNISGTSDYVSFDKYGMGLEWDKTLLEDAEWVQFADILTAFRAAAWNGVAQTHYDLMLAPFTAGKADIAWQNPEPATLANTVETYTANRDAQTLNLACQTIALALADKGYGLTPTSTFLVFTPLQIRGRVRKALALALQPASSALNIDFNIRQVTSMMLGFTDHYYVCFPGARAQSGLRLNLEELTDENILARSDYMVDWLRFGAVIGDTDQIERCNIA